MITLGEVFRRYGPAYRARWGSQWSAAQDDSAKQTAIIKEDHDIVEQLYSLGWDSELDLESELPDKYMPEEYLKRVQKDPIRPEAWGDPALWYGSKRK